MMRDRLKWRRSCETFNFAIDGVRYTASIGRYDDGRIGELFVSSSKIDSATDVAARDAAICLSFALQHGADLDTIRQALTRDLHGNPSGPLGVALDIINSSSTP